MPTMETEPASRPKIPYILSALSGVLLVTQVLLLVNLIPGIRRSANLGIVLLVWAGTLLMIVGPVTYSRSGRILGIAGGLIVLSMMVAFLTFLGKPWTSTTTIEALGKKDLRKLIPIGLFVWLGLLVPVTCALYLALSRKYRGFLGAGEHKRRPRSGGR